VFRHNYGVEKEFPYNYILDAKVCPKNIKFVLKVVKYIVPTRSTPVRMFKEDQPPMITTMQSLFSNTKFKNENVVL